MNERTALYIEVLQYVAKLKKQKYSSIVKALMDQIKVVSLFAKNHSLSIDSKLKEKIFYKRRMWVFTTLYMLLAYLISIILKLDTLYVVLFMFLVVIGLAFVFWISFFKTKMLILDNEKMVLNNKTFSWNEIDEIYMYDESQFIEIFSRYRLIIVMKNKEILIERLLPIGTSVDKVFLIPLLDMHYYAAKISHYIHHFRSIAI